MGQLDARDVFRQIVHGAWKTGEPGVYFIDRANYYNPVPRLGSYEATNPCGEQPLLPYDVCNLGSINLGLFVQQGAADCERLRTAVHVCTHFLDNVIDANNYPLAEIDDLANRIRRIGLGVMGWADLLVHLGIPYDSDEGVALGRRVMEFVDEEAKVASEKLAEQRGVFPEWETSIWGPDASCARGPDGERVRPMRRLRNCNLTTVAPTGTISIIANCSSGIEPLFAVAFMRNQAGVLMPDVNEDFVAIARQEGWYSDDLMQRIAEAGHIHFDAVPAQWQRVFVTAHDVTPEWHIQMQAAFQEFTDSAISKTCNFGHDATEEYVEKIYRYAYKLGCKGVTVYRDASREMQVLSTGATARHDVRHYHRGRPRPAVRGLHLPRQGGRGAHGRRRSRRAADLARAPLGHSHAGDLPPAPGHLVGPGRRPGAQQSALGAGRHRHRDREVDAGPAGHPAGSARRGGTGRGGGGGGGGGGGSGCGGSAAGSRGGAGGGGRRGAPEGRGPAGLHRRLPRLRLAAGVHRGLRQVPRVRILGVRLSGAGA